MHRSLPGSMRELHLSLPGPKWLLGSPREPLALRVQPGALEKSTWLAELSGFR